MKKLVCTQCGAKIDPTSMMCNYCGSAYVNITAAPKSVVTDEKKTNKKTPSPITDDFLVELLNTTCRENRFVKNIFPIMFMAFWTMVCGFIYISIENYGGPGKLDKFGLTGFSLLKFIPFIFVVCGVFITVNIIRKSIPFKLTECLELIKKARYEEAFGWLKSKNDANNNKNYVFAMIILCYYRLNDEDLVRLLFTKLTHFDVSSVNFKNSVIATIATELNVMLPANITSN